MQAGVIIKIGADLGALRRVLRGKAGLSLASA
jgi:hypothetical protein